LLDDLNGIPNFSQSENAPQKNQGLNYKNASIFVLERIFTFYYQGYPIRCNFQCFRFLAHMQVDDPHCYPVVGDRYLGFRVFARGHDVNSDEETDRIFHHLLNQLMEKIDQEVIRYNEIKKNGPGPGSKGTRNGSLALALDGQSFGTFNIITVVAPVVSAAISSWVTANLTSNRTKIKMDDIEVEGANPEKALANWRLAKLKKIEVEEELNRQRRLSALKKRQEAMARGETLDDIKLQRSKKQKPKKPS
jgi:hypothetical protein